MLEAIAMCEEMSGKKLEYKLSDEARSGDHIWYVSDVRRFQKDYPKWSYRYDMRTTLREIVKNSRDCA